MLVDRLFPIIHFSCLYPSNKFSVTVGVKQRKSNIAFFLFQDVGQSILESYSRVMESLAFNIMARIDDLIYVDDMTKHSATAESVSLFSRGGFGGLPVQKKISPSPFSLHNSPSASPFATPTCSSTPVAGSPGREQTPPGKCSLWEQRDGKLEKMVSRDVERLWLYSGNLSARKDSGDAPERD